MGLTSQSIMHTYNLFLSDILSALKLFFIIITKNHYIQKSVKSSDNLSCKYSDNRFQDIGFSLTSAES